MVTLGRCQNSSPDILIGVFSLFPPFHPDSRQQNIITPRPGPAASSASAAELSATPLFAAPLGGRAGEGYFCASHFADTMLSPEPGTAWEWRGHPRLLPEHPRHGGDALGFGKTEKAASSSLESEEGFSGEEGHLRGTDDVALGTGGLREGGGGRDVEKRGILRRTRRLDAAARNSPTGLNWGQTGSIPARAELPDEAGHLRPGMGRVVRREGGAMGGEPSPMGREVAVTGVLLTRLPLPPPPPQPPQKRSRVPTALPAAASPGQPLVAHQHGEGEDAHQHRRHWACGLWEIHHHRAPHLQMRGH